MRTFHIITYGCQMNVRDSEWIANMLRASGFEEKGFEDASVILINTCSVREKPQLKVRNTLGRIRPSPGRLVGILGCVAQQLGRELYAYSPLVRLIAGGDGVCAIPEALEHALANPGLRIELLDFRDTYPERGLLPEKSVSGTAYVNIMQGCDNFCAYCIVPFTRGRQKSRASAAILEECAMRVEQGASDITLLGQNVNAYGKDARGRECAFPELLDKVARIPGLRRLHFMTPHPRDLDLKTIEAFADLPNLCPRLHLPLQSGSDRILQVMGRHYTRADFLGLVESLRAARPDMALSTDLIVGFPGESEDDFEDTLSAMEACGFMSSFSFCYSDRPGTKASLMPDKIPEEIMHERLLKLQELQEKLGSAWLASRVGTRAELLLEAPSARQGDIKNSWQGRDIYGATVHISLPENAGYAGRIVEVEISGAKRHSLVGQFRSFTPDMLTPRHKLSHSTAPSV